MTDKTRVAEIVNLAASEVGAGIRTEVFRGHSACDWRAEVIPPDGHSFYVRIPWSDNLDEVALVGHVRTQIERHSSN